MATKIRYSDDEKLLALTLLAEELGFERRNHFRAHDLFIVSIGRIFLRDFSAQDSVDPEIMIHPVRGHAVAIDGWSWTDRKDPQARLRDKWQQRVNLYLDIYGNNLVHVRDWLLVAAAEAHHWLQNRDDKGRPKKLMKCGTIGALVQEAEKWHRSEPVAVVAQRALGPEDVRWEADAGGGYHIVRLLSPEALDAETLALRHCIGRGSYDHMLDESGFEYFSIRDAEGTPVATVELAHGLILQSRGYRNAAPEAAVQAALYRYLAARFDAWKPKVQAMVEDVVDPGHETEEQQRARENEAAANFVGGLMRR